MDTFKKAPFIILFCIPLITYSQDFTIPDYKTQQDYTDQMDNVVKVCNWLNNHPLNDKDRKNANAYLIAWASGTSSVSVAIAEYVLKLTDKNPDFLALFIANWVLYSTDTDSFDNLEANFFATRSVVDYYLKMPEVVKDKDLDKLGKLQTKNKLRDWVKSQIQPLR